MITCGASFFVDFTLLSLMNENPQKIVKYRIYSFIIQVNPVKKKWQPKKMAPIKN